MKHRMVAQLRERCSSVGSASEGRGSVVEQILPYFSHRFDFHFLSSGRSLSELLLSSMEPITDAVGE